MGHPKAPEVSAPPGGSPPLAGSSLGPGRGRGPEEPGKMQGRAQGSSFPATCRTWSASPGRTTSPQPRTCFAAECPPPASTNTASPCRKPACGEHAACAVGRASWRRGRAAGALSCPQGASRLKEAKLDMTPAILHAISTGAWEPRVRHQSSGQGGLPGGGTGVRALKDEEEEFARVNPRGAAGQRGTGCVVRAVPESWVWAGEARRVIPLAVREG